MGKYMRKCFRNKGVQEPGGLIAQYLALFLDDSPALIGYFCLPIAELGIE